ncbi:hypothetical protein N0V82_005108 [Gnomoniopsis sp. IMI 355080]|nr:hypothetical protein N0V82_005108 [Gnomoniopsis sp. IMI 355080]
MAIEPLFEDPTTTEFGQSIMSEFMDMDTSSEARSWLEKYAINDGQLGVDWSSPTAGVSQYGSSSIIGLPPSPASLSPPFGGHNPAIGATQEPSTSTMNGPSGILQVGAPVILQLLQLGVRLSVLYDSCSRLANSTQPFSHPIPDARRARLVNNVAFDSVAVWLAQGYSSVENNIQASPHAHAESWRSPLSQGHPSSAQETQASVQGQSILQEVFSASHDFLDIFRHLNADRAKRSLGSNSGTPSIYKLNTHSAGNWGHNGVVLPDKAMQSGLSEGQAHDTKVVRHLVMACDMMLLRIHLAVLIALHYDARMPSQPTGSVLEDARVILVVQLCSLLIERQCQAVDLFNVEESSTPTPLSSTFPERPLLADRQAAIDLRAQVQATLVDLRQTLHCTI